MNNDSHHDYMTLALQLAEQGRYSVSPNPMVGCVIVKNNQIVGRGFHQRAGEAHAEVHALREAGANAQDATAYVTLEPCHHFGRTPPCTQALIQAGIKKVYIACLDPNPLVSGRGVTCLQNAGMTVEVGLCASQAKSLNEIFFHYITTKRPFVISKWAMSLDGKTITNSSDSPQITSTDAQQHTHALRRQVDVILVGANTVRHDNPQLTARAGDAAGMIHKQPLRVVLTSQGNLPLHLNVFNQTLPGKTLIVSTALSDKKWRDEVDANNIDLLIVPAESDGAISLPFLLEELGKRELTSVLVEGGMAVHNSFFKLGLVNKIHVYVAPVFIGTCAAKLTLPPMEVSKLGKDFCLTVNKENTHHV